jgi:hypothetical protein
MNKISEMDCARLTWIQSSCAKRAVLCSGKEIFGFLHWEGTDDSLAHAQAMNQRWTFRRAGFFIPQITVHAGDGSAAATFNPHWDGGGILDFPGNQRFHWAGSGFGQSHWAFIKNVGEPLVLFKPRSLLSKKIAAVEATPVGRQYPEFPLLILLGWYLIVLRSDDVAVPAACSASA